MAKTLNPEIYKIWSRHDDFSHRMKKVASWDIELIGGTKRGGVILLKSKKHDFEDELNFMNWSNALSRYNRLTNEKKIMYAIEENN